MHITISIVCHHLITRESVRNAYGRPLFGFPESDITLLHIITTRLYYGVLCTTPYFVLRRSDSISIMTGTEWLPKE